MKYDVVIIGAGIAGLACARVLRENNISTVIVEGQDRPGGRIKTDKVDGFRLDRGFQVLQTGYPEAQVFFDYNRLRLHTFPAGVAVYRHGKFNIIADPRKYPGYLLSTLKSPVGKVTDRLRMLRLANSVARPSFSKLFQEPEEKTIDYLKARGFSQQFIESFFTPFFAGACLDRHIQASSRVLRYIFRVFAGGDAALPAEGMEALPRQLADTIGRDFILCGSPATAIEENKVRLENGQEIQCRRVVAATSLPELRTLIQVDDARKSVGERCLYYGADWLPPMKEPFLILNGEGAGPINNIAFPSLVAPQYSSSGKTLIAIVVLGQDNLVEEELESQVRNQCLEWFGSPVNDWQHLRTYTIDHALTTQEPPSPDPYQMMPPVAGWLRVCGEYGSLPGTQWSLLSGRKTGEAVAAELS